VNRHLGRISKAVLVESRHWGRISKAVLVVSRHWGRISKAAPVSAGATLRGGRLST